MTLSTQQQERRGPGALQRQQEVGRTRGAAGGRPGVTGLITNVQTHSLLAEIVDRIADWDVRDGDVARLLTPKTLPSTCPYFLAYRAPIRSDRCSSGYRHRLYGTRGNHDRAGVVRMRPSGPIGVLIIRLKPEAAACLMGERMQDFVNEKIDLGRFQSARRVLAGRNADGGAGQCCAIRAGRGFSASNRWRKREGLAPCGDVDPLFTSLSFNFRGS